MDKSHLNAACPSGNSLARNKATHNKTVWLQHYLNVDKCELALLVHLQIDMSQVSEQTISLALLYFMRHSII